MVRSREFVIPPKLSLYVCGHLGYPDRPASPVNMVRLRVVGTDQVVAEALAPRNDNARLVSWDLKAHAGKRGVLEVIDGLDLKAYAWIAVARVDPPVVVVPKLDPEVVARRSIAAAQLAETFGLRELEPAVRRIVVDELAEPTVRAAAAAALTSFHPDPRRSALIRIVADPKLSVGLREAILTDVASADRPASKELVGQVARELPARLQASLAESLAETSDGADLLLTLIEAGSLAASHLQSAVIEGKLRSHGDGRFAAAVAKLTSALPPIEEKTRQLIAARSQGFVHAASDATRGRLVFEKNCAGCHQIGGRGALVGPQLDGEGLRGSERVLEDILDPNRNVDPAFHATLLALRDGRVISGLVRREEGPNLILVDRNGKETPIPSAEVEERKLTRLSPMPADFGVVIAEGDLYDLVAFLLAQARAAAAPVSWRVVPIDSRFRSEGVAVADINRDGRPDIVAGEARGSQAALDLDADGRADVVSSSPHAYGIWSFLPRPASSSAGDPVFERVDLFPKLASQTHALLMEDIDGDGLKNLVTGHLEQEGSLPLRTSPADALINRAGTVGAHQSTTPRLPRFVDAETSRRAAAITRLRLQGNASLYC